MSEQRHPAAAWVGLAYVLAGTLLLLEHLDVIALSWAVAVPALLVLLGLALLVNALTGRSSTSSDA